MKLAKKMTNPSGIVIDDRKKMSNKSILAECNRMIWCGLNDPDEEIDPFGMSKVRQMFEDRRNQINGRPPLQPTYARNHVTRRASPTKGRDRSYPLDPLPVKTAPDRRTVNQRQPATNYRSRGASLERGRSRQDRPDDDRIRRSKSQFQVDEILAAPARTQEAKPSRSMNSLIVDDNQNDVYDAPPPARNPYR